MRVNLTTKATHYIHKELPKIPVSYENENVSFTVDYGLLADAMRKRGWIVYRAPVLIGGRQEVKILEGVDTWLLGWVDA